MLCWCRMSRSLQHRAFVQNTVQYKHAFIYMLLCCAMLRVQPGASVAHIAPRTAINATAQPNGNANAQRMMRTHLVARRPTTSPPCSRAPARTASSSKAQTTSFACLAPQKISREQLCRAGSLRSRRLQHLQRVRDARGFSLHVLHVERVHHYRCESIESERRKRAAGPEIAPLERTAHDAANGAAASNGGRSSATTQTPARVHRRKSDSV